MEARGRGLMALLALLTGATCAVVLAEGWAERRRAERSEEAQRLVGGLGFGPALDLSGCAFGLDPRLDGSCAEDCGPVPGGACFCPRHAATLIVYPPLRRGGPDLLIQADVGWASKTRPTLRGADNPTALVDEGR
jgi:hypothetical protein